MLTYLNVREGVLLLELLLGRLHQVMVVGYGAGDAMLGRCWWLLVDLGEVVGVLGTNRLVEGVSLRIVGQKKWLVLEWLIMVLPFMVVVCCRWVLEDGGWVQNVAVVWSVLGLGVLIDEVGVQEVMVAALVVSRHVAWLVRRRDEVVIF